MTERIRTDWKGRHDALSVELEQARKELDHQLSNAFSLGKENDGLRAEIEELKKRVERAKLEGARGLADFMLGDSR